MCLLYLSHHSVKHALRISVRTQPCPRCRFFALLRHCIWCAAEAKHCCCCCCIKHSANLVPAHPGISPLAFFTPTVTAGSRAVLIIASFPTRAKNMSGPAAARQQAELAAAQPLGGVGQRVLPSLLFTPAPAWCAVMLSCSTQLKQCNPPDLIRLFAKRSNSSLSSAPLWSSSNAFRAA